MDGYDIICTLPQQPPSNELALGCQHRQHPS